MSNILNKIFSIKNAYKHLKKFKIFTIFGFKIKFQVKNTKRVREYIRTNKPQLLTNVTPIGNIPSGKDTLAICAIFKNEPDIIEWIEYHKLVGVERFYLYDNESDFNSLDILQPYINDGTVIYHYVSGRCMQMPSYRDAVYRYKMKTKWLAIIDLDEYIVPVEKDNIIDFLKDYEDYPAIGINWVCFDANLHVRRPEKLVIEAYTRSNGGQCTIKSIVKPNKVSCIINPHFCFYKHQKLAVNENFTPIAKSLKNFVSIYDNASSKYSGSKIRINHYHVKSYEDYMMKKMIGFADQKNKRPDSDALLYFENGKKDYVIQKYLPELKKRMENV